MGAPFGYFSVFHGLFVMHKCARDPDSSAMREKTGGASSATIGAACWHALACRAFHLSLDRRHRHHARPCQEAKPIMGRKRPLEISRRVQLYEVRCREPWMAVLSQSNGRTGNVRMTVLSSRLIRWEPKSGEVAWVPIWVTLQDAF